MDEAYEYIPSDHFVDLIEGHCPLATCNSKKHGYTCFVESGDDSESFAIISEGREDTYVYYDAQAARGRTRLFAEKDRDKEADNVSQRVLDTDLSPDIGTFIHEHIGRLRDDWETAPEAPLGAFVTSDYEGQLGDIIFAGGVEPADSEVRDTFRTEVENRRLQLHGRDDARHDRFGKMFGWRIEPLTNRVRPDIVIELLLLGAYQQVVEAIEERR